jgi:hypothetical protein
MNRTLFYSFFIFVIILLGCNSEPANKNEKVSEEDVSFIENLTLLNKEKGLASLKTNCYSCHNPQSTSHDDMLAPPLAGIKFKYQNHYPERSEFIVKMSNFIHSPTSNNAVMRGPVRHFGLMPKVPLELEEIRQVVAYIYDNEMETPEWFSDHFEEQHGKKWK